KRTCCSRRPVGCRETGESRLLPPPECARANALNGATRMFQHRASGVSAVLRLPLTRARAICEVLGKPDAGGISAGQRRSAISPRLLADPFELPLGSKDRRKQMGHSQSSLSSQCVPPLCDSARFVGLGLRRKVNGTAGVAL